MPSSTNNMSRRDAGDRLCVFCDARAGSNPRFLAAAASLGRAMAGVGIGLVFGGSADGTMGRIATAVKENGGRVTSVLSLATCCRADRPMGGVDEVHTAMGLRDRKRLMSDLADGFVALPGGVGVLDALMEHLTWVQRGRMAAKPVYLVNSEGYWDHLLEMFSEMREQGYLPEDFDHRYVIVDDANDVVDRFRRRAQPLEARHGNPAPGAVACTSCTKGARTGSLCVFCGSNVGRNPRFREKAKQLGNALAGAGLGLVYGGGGRGLMGEVATSASRGGGHVTGVIPRALTIPEEVHEGVDECHIVNDYHERKTLMENFSDGFAALPGGPGTLEELAEQLTFADYGCHDKPIYVLNVDGYWNNLLKMLARMREAAFADQRLDARYHVVEEPGTLVSMFMERGRPAAGHVPREAPRHARGHSPNGATVSASKDDGMNETKGHEAIDGAGKSAPSAAMSGERPTVHLAAHVILFDADRVLMLRRTNTPYMAGKYCLPGGYVEPGESAVRAATRETFEECGLRLAERDLAFAGVLHRFTGEPRTRVDIFFTCRAWVGTPVIAEPLRFDDLTWVPLDAPPPNVVPHVAMAIEAMRNGASWYRELGWGDAGRT